MPDEKFAYLHGKLTLFEELETKAIAEIRNVNQRNTVFPYLLVQSGVKPIISSYQIREFYNACQMVDNSDYLLILGYGINSDDEHIINILRNRLRIGKKIIYFIHARDDAEFEEQKDYVETQLGNKNLVEYYNTNEFLKIINGIVGK